MYTKKTLDYFNKTENLGHFSEDEPFVGTGIVGAPECGDVLSLQIKVDPVTKVIVDAKFKVFGCVSAIASSALLVEKLKGLTLDEAWNLHNKDIADELVLPPAKIHCSVLAANAVKKAIQNYRKLYS